jgi:MFS family permease
MGSGSATTGAPPADRSADDLRAGERVAIYLILALASFAYNFNFLAVDYIRPYLVRDGVMTLQQTALLYTAQATGVLAGSFLTPPIIARSGARNGVALAATLLAAGSLVNMSVDSYAIWIVVRLVVGVALAGCYVGSITMLANLVPQRIRGRVLSVNMAMFSIAQMSFGMLSTVVGGAWRELLLIAAALPALVVVLTLLRVPDDRRLVVCSDAERAQAIDLKPGTWREMLTGRRLKFTAACILLAGLNFSAYQFYSGFITTYLYNVRRLPPELIGWFVVVDGVGGLIGTIALGWVADKYGRKSVVWGFPVAAAAIIALLVAPTWVPLMLLIEACYMAGMSCTNCWAAYFAELFPVRLRPMGTALFHGGHVVSLFAPLIVATVAAHSTLTLGMALAPATLLVAALIWWALPETLRSARGFRGFDADAAAAGA